MRQLSDIAELGDLPGPVCLALGVFDGLHRGHKALLAETRKQAKARGGSAVVLTFDPHPLKVLRPDAAPKILSSSRHKWILLARESLDAILVQRFDPPFAATPPGEFIGALVDACRPLGLVAVGQGFAFGKRRSGHVPLIEEYGRARGFDVMELPSVLEDGEPISSTRIRQAVRDGQLSQAALLLGRPFALYGEVVKGDGIGKELGFPTANIAPEGEMLPPTGVYAGRCQVGAQSWPAAVDIGTRPTVTQAGELRVEAHLIGYVGNLYGQQLEIELLERLRGEKKFTSTEELRKQIERDCQATIRACEGAASTGE